MKKTTTTPETPNVTADKPTPVKTPKKTPANEPATALTVNSKPEPSATVESSKTKPKPAVVTKASKTQPQTPASLEVVETSKAASPVLEKTTQVSPKKASPKPKITEKAAVVVPDPTPAAPKLAMHERIGLTAGAIWQYLAEHGTTPVAKLIYVLPEEESVVQRSIGWLTQEGKITLSAEENQVETLTLNT